MPLPTLQGIIENGPGRSGGGTNQVTLVMQNEFNINSLDPSTMREVVRDQIEPELIGSLESHLKKTSWKQILGV